MIHSTILLSIFVRQTSDGRPIFWCILGVCIGIYLFIRGFALLKKRHLVLDTPASKIRSAPLGMVELNGLAAGPYTLVAPITGRACYYYRTVIWEWKRRGRSSQWVVVANECMHLPFFLDDNTGKIMIDPRGAELELHRDYQQEFCDGFFTTKQKAPPNVHDFLLRYGVNTTNKIKVEEFCIKPKNALFLLGTLGENPGLEVTAQPMQDFGLAQDRPATRFSFSLGASNLSLSDSGGGFNLFPGSATRRGTRAPEEERLQQAVFGQSDSTQSAVATSNQVIRLSPEDGPDKSADMTQQQKIAAALVKAGITNPAAWAAAGVNANSVPTNKSANGSPASGVGAGASQPASQSKPATDGFEQRPLVVLMKGTNNPTFIISWRSQRELARSMGWKCTLMIWGGPALTIFCLYALHNMTQWF